MSQSQCTPRCVRPGVRVADVVTIGTEAVRRLQSLLTDGDRFAASGLCSRLRALSDFPRNMAILPLTAEATVRQYVFTTNELRGLPCP
jgi:hypothetical protein